MGLDPEGHHLALPGRDPSSSSKGGTLVFNRNCVSGQLCISRKAKFSFSSVKLASFVTPMVLLLAKFPSAVASYILAVLSTPTLNYQGHQ